jgi:predicted DNA-binding transcriptional regulator AlpA
MNAEQMPLDATTFKPASDAAGAAPMLNTMDVAKLLNCCERHVRNLRKEGRIPLPVKLGTCVRWPRCAIANWIEASCPANQGNRGNTCKH